MIPQIKNFNLGIGIYRKVEWGSLMTWFETGRNNRFFPAQPRIKTYFSTCLFPLVSSLLPVPSTGRLKIRWAFNSNLSFFAVNTNESQGTHTARSMSYFFLLQLPEHFPSNMIIPTSAAGQGKSCEDTGCTVAYGIRECLASLRSF